MPTKKYNQADRKTAVKGRRDAVLFLISRGHTFKSAGYAVGKTGEFARSVYAKAARKV